MVDNLFTGTMILVGVLSLIFSMGTTWRLYSYIHAYHFERDKYYPLFGVIPLQFFIVIYIVGAVAIVIASLVVFSLI